MTTYPEPNSSQVVIYPGGRPFWLGTLGNVTGLVYSYIYPGGPDKATCTLEVPAAFQSQALAVNSPAKIFRGGHQIWTGTLTKPVPGPGGLAVTLKGDGNAGDDFRYIYTSSWPTSQPDEGINNAIGRGMPWVNPTLGQPSGIWLGDQVDSGASSVTEILTAMSSKGGLGWYVNAQPGGAIGTDITLAALPVTPTRLLVVPSPVPRTDGGDIRAIYVKYQTAADNTTTGAVATYAVTSVTNTGHGGSEVFMDLSSSGVMSAGSAQAVASKVLQLYVRASFGGTFDVAPGYLLTTGGVPVDPGTEQAGFVCQVIMMSYDYGGEVSPLVPPQFLVGGYEWDDQARKGTITPYQTFDATLANVIGAVTPAAPAAATAA
jgi:hypothetical protein